MLVVDASASMSTEDAPGPRIDAATAAADGLVDALPNDAVLGLVTYGTSTDDAPESQAAGCRDVTTMAKPTELGTDGHRDALREQIDGLSPRGYTPIAESLRQAAGMLPAGDAAVIVISDGEDSCGDPPCEAAAQLREQNPGLRISTVGFKTATPELACIARATDGLFVTADNADQLASRLLAAREVDQNASALTPTGMGGIEIGAHFNDIRSADADFPEQSAGDAEGENTVITYGDCDYVFGPDGKVVEIRPHAGRTVDGLAVGDPLSRAVELYGDEVDPAAGSPGASDPDTRFFAASREAGTAWKITTDGDRVSAVALCGCLAGSGDGSGASSDEPRRSTTMVGDTEVVTYRPYLDDGSLAPGFEVRDEMQFEWVCGESPEGFFKCGQAYTDWSKEFCSTDGESVWCLAHEDSDEPRFVRHPFGGENSNSYNPRPAAGPLPVYVELADGSQCRLGFEPGNMRTGATHFYVCGDAENLWAKDGQGVFTTDGTWTSLKGEMDNSPLETVQVARAVFFK